MPSHWLRPTIALLLSPIGLLLISATRLLIIANYSTTTATTVASSGGYINTLLGTAIPLVPIFIPYIAVLLLAFRRYVLSILALAATVFISPTLISLPTSYRIARIEEHEILSQASQDWPLTAVIIILIFVIIYAIRLFLYEDSHIIRSASTVLAISAAVALTPYLYNLYPVPHVADYYAAAARQPWLPAEKVSLKSGQLSYGWVLSENQDWFTVLQIATRTIRYIPTGEISTRVICQAPQSVQLKSYLPLIPLVHAKPAKLPACPYEDSSIEMKSKVPHRTTTGSSKSHHRATAHVIVFPENRVNAAIPYSVKPAQCCHQNSALGRKSNRQRHLSPKSRGSGHSHGDYCYGDNRSFCVKRNRYPAGHESSGAAAIGLFLDRDPHITQSRRGKKTKEGSRER